MRIRLALLISTLVVLNPLPPPTLHADQAAIRPGEAIGPLKLGARVDEIARAFGRTFTTSGLQGCGGRYQWTYQEGDPVLSAGEDAAIWTPVISGRPSERAGAITIEGEKGQFTTAGGVGLGSRSQEVTAELGPPSAERQEGDGTYLVYENIGIQFLTQGEVVRAVTVYWPRLKSLDVRPFGGIGPVTLGMEAPRAATAMGRPSDVITALGRQAWALPAPPTASRTGCGSSLAIRIGSTGKVRDVFTTAAGFRTPGGVQIGDSIEGLVKELGAGRASLGPVGEILWVKPDPPRATFIVGYRAGEDGVKRILYFWSQAF